MSEEQAPPKGGPDLVVGEAHNIDTYDVPKAMLESVPAMIAGWESGANKA